MPHQEWCKKPCSDCQSPCSLDQSIPCSPDCPHLNADGTVYMSGCIDARCSNIANYVFCEGRLVDLDGTCKQCAKYQSCDKPELMNTLKGVIYSRHKAAGF